MKPAELAQVRERLLAFTAQMFASLPRSDQRRWGETYLRGLMVDGHRKSIEPMAARLPDGDEQCLQQFVNQSPWEWEPVRKRLALRMSAAIAPRALIVDDTGFPKAGRYSVGVARQYSGTLGKVGNCQIGVSVSAASEAASCTAGGAARRRDNGSGGVFGRAAGTVHDWSRPTFEPLATPLPQDKTATPLRGPRSAPTGARVRLVAAPAPARRTMPPLGVWSVIVGSRVLALVAAYLAVTRLPQAVYARRLIYNPTALLSGAPGRWLNAWADWDGQWYVRIAREGYRARVSAAFFPLYPLLLRVLSPLVAHSYVVVGVALSLACYVAAMVVLYRLVTIDYGDRVASWTVVFASVFPTSFFFQAVYTESIFLLTTVTCLYFARRERWLLAGLAGFLAALTRNTGILVLLPMALFYLSARGWRLRQLDRRLAFFALVPAGLALWMVYLLAKFGDPLAFSRAQDYWHRHLSTPWTTIDLGVRKGIAGIQALMHNGEGTPSISSHNTLLIPVTLPNALAFVSLVGAVVVLVLSVRRLKLPYAAYAWASLAAPLFYPAPRQPLYSLPRFLVVIFPVFLGLALVSERLKVTRVAISVAFMLGLLLLTSVFVRFNFVA